ncbi:MAG: hypothetical protein ACTHJ0_00895 [Flavipsychrobacter sp.]
MSVLSPTLAFFSVASTISTQGKEFDYPKSVRNEYYAFLSMCIFDDSTEKWSVLFELLPTEWVKNVYEIGSMAVKDLAPTGPASWYYIESATASALEVMMGVDSVEELAEGSWYILTIQEGKTGELFGDFYSPEIAKDPENPELFYGVYTLMQAKLILLPDLVNGNIVLTIVENELSTVKIKTAISLRYFPFGQQYKSSPAKINNKSLLKAEPPYSIGALDIGISACNSIYGGGVPFLYFDVGYPINALRQSLPDYLRNPASPAWRGPVTNNNVEAISIILSHWHYDHWGLGEIVAGLRALRWIYPLQPIGGAAVAFLNTIPNNLKFFVAANAQAGYYDNTNIFIYPCTPPNNARQMLLNNSGLSMVVPIDDKNILMTADANFDSIGRPVPIVGNIIRPGGIQAVHHGSGNNGAIVNIPNPPVGIAHPFVFYSYGAWVQEPELRYAYGFPTSTQTINTVNAYNAAGWPMQFQLSTAQGYHIRNTNNMDDRGNILIGPNVANYPNTAFDNFRYQV